MESYSFICGLTGEVVIRVRANVISYNEYRFSPKVWKDSIKQLRSRENESLHRHTTNE